MVAPGSRRDQGNVIANARNGGITELHFGGGPRFETLDSLPTIITNLRARGYRFVTLAQMLGLRLIYKLVLMVSQVRIREVGPHDGFQNEPKVIATADKVRLIELLGASGLKRIEVTSFVRPDVIPQLADAAKVLDAVRLPADVSISVLIPNERGLERALPLRSRFHEVNGSCRHRRPTTRRMWGVRWRSRSTG